MLLRSFALRTLDDFISTLRRPTIDKLSAPPYILPEENKGKPVACAVESMRRHMTDEGWQIMAGLNEAGYDLAGFNLHTPNAEIPGGASFQKGFSNLTDMRAILGCCNPKTLVIQDKREWDTRAGDFREKLARFSNVEVLKDIHTTFKVTILKDAHQRADYHRASADEMGAHAWIIYYHPRLIGHIAPYVRRAHLIRTYHSFDSNLPPPFLPGKVRAGCLLSGAVSGAYPERRRLIDGIGNLGLGGTETVYVPHPGYHMRGSNTPGFLQLLGKYKVAICTSSCYGYALRKIIEATACGCIVLTDLPSDEVLPEIDGNLIRVDFNRIPLHELGAMITTLVNSYDNEMQMHWASKALWYDYKAVGQRLAADIESLRLTYPLPSLRENA